MTKRFYIYLLIFLAIISASTFSGRELTRFNTLKLDHFTDVLTLNFVPNESEHIVKASMLLVGKSFIDFGNAVGLKESNNNYKAISKYGYLGKYQFGKATLKIYGIHDTEEFINSPELQEKVFKAYVASNKWHLKDEIKKYSGKTMNGTVITESGILASAHLAGALNVKVYLQNHGNIRFQDNFGTSIRHFMKRFGGYDTSVVDAEKNPSLENYTE